MVVADPKTAVRLGTIEVGIGTQVRRRHRRHHPTSLPLRLRGSSQQGSPNLCLDVHLKAPSAPLSVPQDRC